MMQEVHKFQIGTFKCTIFKDLMFKYQAKDYFINVEEKKLEGALDKYKIAPDNIPSPYISMLLEDDNRKILIDSGIGFSEDPIVFRGNKFILKGQLSQLLQQEGVSADDISDVIITHFHPDHIGGMYSDKRELNFPNARFHVHEDEWNYWHSSKSAQQPGLFKYFIEENITPLAKQDLNLIKGDLTDILPGIKAIKAEGHTPGQIAVLINEGKESLLYISDAFLHPLHIEHLTWQTNYDLDHNQAKRTREKLLDLAYTEGIQINAFHFDFPGLGRVDKVNEKWFWQYAN